jgi:putative phosphoribosyl transferase
VEINSAAVDSFGISQSYVDEVSDAMRAEIRSRYEKYRGDPEPPSLRGKIAIIVDDGVATGYTIRAAVRYVRQHSPKKIIVVVPVSSSDAAARLKQEADEFICPEMREDFFAVGQFYRHFPQITDEEAARLLGRT